MGPVYIKVDTTLGAASVPAGTYDFQQRIFLNASAPTTLTLSESVVFQRLVYVKGALTLVSSSSSPIISNSNEFSTLILDTGATLRANGSAPFIYIGTNGYQVIVLLTSAHIDDGVSAAVILDDSTAYLVVRLGVSSAVLDAAAIAGSAGNVLISFVSDLMTAGEQTGFTGTMMTQLATETTRDGYVPSVVANWNNVAPVDVNTTLDRIAAALGPIE